MNMKEKAEFLSVDVKPILNEYLNKVLNFNNNIFDFNS